MLAAPRQAGSDTVAGQVSHWAEEGNEAAAVSGFLQRLFQEPESSLLVDRRHLAWKYWSRREDWSGPRSFTARHDGAIVAHVGAWPVRVLLAEQSLSAAHLIDLASDPRFPGAGFWLLRQIRSRTRLLIGTGGTEITRRMLPAAGFRVFGNVDCFARPLRPFAQSRTATRKNWRLAGRFVRNSAWRWSTSGSAPVGWSAAPIDPGDVDDTVWPRPSRTMAVTFRDAAFYRYVLASPLTRHSLLGVRQDGRLVGFFCIAYARHVARIADLWVQSTNVDDWRSAIRTACDAAMQSKDIHEVTAWTSTALGRDAMARAGFRLRDRMALTLYGDTAPLAGCELHLQMLDCDASFVAADQVCYLT